MRRRGGPDPATALPAPAGLEAFQVEVGGERFVVLEWQVHGSVPQEYELTAAERDVARLLIGGCTNAEIARRRRASPRTVAKQVSSIFRKLKVGSRAELLARLARAR